LLTPRRQFGGWEQLVLRVRPHRPDARPRRERHPGRPPRPDGHLLTDCCEASAKGSCGGTVCRKCYRGIDPPIGGEPAAPYRDEADNITTTKVEGWETYREWAPSSRLSSFASTS